LDSSISKYLRSSILHKIIEEANENKEIKHRNYLSS